MLHSNKMHCGVFSVTAPDAACHKPLGAYMLSPFCVSQVQQQLQMLGSMTLQDPCLRRAVSRQPKRLRKAAKSQQQQLQQVLPLAGVSLKAAAGWYCQLDEFQADFASAVADVR